MFWGLLALATLAADPLPVDTVVVCPREFSVALDPLLAHRYAQGHRMAYIPSTWTADEIRAGIRQAAAKSGNLKFVLLVGDADPAAVKNPALRARCVPTHLAAAKVNIKYGSEPEIATDNWYADLDDDTLPDLAIGRLPADSPAEVTLLVSKILAYEKSFDFGAWRQNIHFVAGVGNFGGLVDSVVEMSTKKFLTDGIPPAYNTTMTYASWRSPFCPDPRLFQKTVVAKHNSGCLFWVYLGHGSHDQLDLVAIPGERFPILRTADCPKLKAEAGLPIAIMLACYTAAFDQPRDCLAEEMLRAPQGPVAVIGGTRVTMPYGMAVLGTQLLDEHFQHQPETIGEALLNAKRESMAPVVDDEKNPLKNLNRRLLDGVASIMSPSRGEMEAERREHLLLMNLLGDPLLRLPHPQTVEVTSPAEATAGQTITVTGNSPLTGKCLVELVCRRDSFKGAVEARERFDPSDVGLADFQPLYEHANDRVWNRQAFTHPGGAWQAKIAIPPDAQGPCHIKVFVEGKAAHALGAANLWVHRPESPKRAPPPAQAARLP